MTDRIAEIESAGTDVAASNRLAEIRASMSTGGAGGTELEAGEKEPAAELPEADAEAAGGAAGEEKKD